MSPRRRRIFTAGAALWLTAGVYSGTALPLAVFNVVLASLAIPMVWLIWVFARASAHEHADRWARDIEKVHVGAGRPRPLPHQVVGR